MIRSIAISDIPAIADIERVEQITPLSDKTLYKWFAEGYFGWTFCMEGGDVAGYTIVDKIQNKECRSVTTCISKHFQSMGIGRELCAYAINALKDLGVETIHFEVRASNIAEQKMVAHFGAEVVDVRHKYYGNEDGLIMVIKMENFK